MSEKLQHPVAAQIQQAVLSAVHELELPLSDQITSSQITIEHPVDEQHGDYATNIALQLFGRLKDKTPFVSARAVAEKIVDNMQRSAASERLFSSITVAGPGFINFFLSEEFLLDESISFWEENFCTPKHWKEQRVVTEFTDPNPFKELHIGHAYSNTIGEAISRLFERSGATVQRVCYQGDVGMHVAKSVWGMAQKLQKDSNEPLLAALAELEQLELKERIHFLGQSYALGATAYKEDQAAAEVMKNINYITFHAAQQQLVAEKGWEPQVDYGQYITDAAVSPDLDAETVTELFRKGRSWSLEYFGQMYDQLGMQFDDFFFESEVGEYGMQIVKEYQAQGVFVESQGAIIFPGSEQGLHDRVFINSLGLPTYETKELGLAPEKNRRWPYDHSVIITGNEIDEYFKVLLLALSKTNPDLAAKTHHLSHGMVRLPEGKMSSRTGKIITAEWVLTEARRRIEVVLQDREGLDDAQKQDIARAVGLGAIKFAFLRSSIGKDVAFDFDSSLSFQGKSGPYIQYTYVRAHALRAAIAQQLDESQSSIAECLDIFKSTVNQSNAPVSAEQKKLLRYLYRYYESLAAATHNYAPHHVCEYVYELSQRFNVWYSSVHLRTNIDRDLAADGVISAQTLSHIAVVVAVENALKDGLTTLGMPLVTQM